MATKDDGSQAFPLQVINGHVYAADSRIQPFTDTNGVEHPDFRTGLVALVYTDRGITPEAVARGVNNHDALVGALKGLRSLILGECGASAYECVDGERADAAIAKAEGQ